MNGGVDVAVDVGVPRVRLLKQREEASPVVGVLKEVADLVY